MAELLATIEMKREFDGFRNIPSGNVEIIEIAFGGCFCVGKAKGGDGVIARGV